MSWIKLGLQDVLYDPKTGEVFAPNTGNRTMLGEKASGGEETPPGESKDDPAPPGEMEQRGNGRNYIKDPKTGRFLGSRKSTNNSSEIDWSEERHGRIDQKAIWKKVFITEQAIKKCEKYRLVESVKNWPPLFKTHMQICCLFPERRITAMKLSV